ncbi:MAG: MarR family transcriptional regulator [Pseudomonas sp.]|uniref:helix-turn-helix transcriptional regulator n=1 Tax=Pseudomonas sp. TaxID=306 RepID=UPI000CC2997C|nr:HTH domain-containing protein [Pseudomonas sp.]PJI45941.1 MAG: MarR family transcriptional regulator [Pseudomonas sp.]
MLQGMGRTQQDLLAALLYQAGGMSIDELAEQLAVTRTAVRQHLAALERDALILRGPTRPTGRRPEQLYLLSPRGRELFPRHYQLLGDLLIGEIAQLIGAEALQEMMRKLGTRLAGELEAEPVSEERIAEHLSDNGYEAQVFFRSSGEAEIVAHNCVFHHLAEQHPEVCELDLALIGTLGGHPVEHLECMHRGGETCRFQLRREPA